MANFLKYRSAQVLLVLLMYIACADFLPESVHVSFYTLSVLIKDLLIWMMPLTIGFFIAHTVSSFEKKAPLFVIMILLFEGCSNFSSVWYAYAISHGAVAWLPSFHVSPISAHMNPLWTFPWRTPSWWSANYGAALGLFVGFIGAWLGRDKLLFSFLQNGKKVVELVLTKFFARLLPLFILGFTAKMYQTRLLDHVVQHYAWATVYLTLGIVVYLSFLVALGAFQADQSLSGFGRTWLRHIKNLAGPAGIAFSTGCSLSTMPWTIQGTSKNMKDPALAQAVIPTTTNIQQVGDCILQGFLCATIYYHFYGHLPALHTWLAFTIVFTLARFATAAILGGAIFVMLPLYETYLNFTPEMIAIVLALNTVLDPLVTSSNVMGNGALCRVFERVWGAVYRTLTSWRGHLKTAS